MEENEILKAIALINSGEKTELIGWALLAKIQNAHTGEWVLTQEALFIKKAFQKTRAFAVLFKKMLAVKDFMKCKYLLLSARPNTDFYSMCEKRFNKLNSIFQVF